MNVENVINFDTIIELWDELGFKCLILKEKEVIYKFFKQIVDGKLLKRLEFKDVVKFFEEKMNVPQSFKNFTVDAFYSYKAFFAFINEEKKNIFRVESENQGVKRLLNIL